MVMTFFAHARYNSHVPNISYLSQISIFDDLTVAALAALAPPIIVDYYGRLLSQQVTVFSIEMSKGY